MFKYNLTCISIYEEVCLESNFAEFPLRTNMVKKHSNVLQFTSALICNNPIECEWYKLHFFQSSL